ncbi:MAG: hypothetical protein ABL995_04575 [Bryobacteraceae bacterium]
MVLASFGTFLIALAIGQAAALIGANVAPAAFSTVSFFAGAHPLETLSSEMPQAAAAVGDADQLERWAEFLRAQNKPEGAHQALVLASRFNPHSANAWAGLGFEAARAGHLAEARADFDHAFAVDHQYQPAWTLANFCFRQNDAECFWRAAKRAAQVAAPDTASSEFAPLLRLADARALSPIEVLHRLDGGARIERAYLDQLIGARRLPDAVVVAKRMAASGRAEDAARLDDFVNRLIDAGTWKGAPDISAGVAIWNALRRFAPLDPEHGVSLTNGGFSTQPGNTGFDWRVPRGGGVAASWKPGEIFLRASEDAFAPPKTRAFDLLTQMLPLAAGRYRLSAEYRTDAAGTPARLPQFRWETDGAKSQALEASSEWREAHFEFRAAVPAYYRLRLRCLREPGMSAAAISIRLRRIRLEVA